MNVLNTRTCQFYQTNFVSRRHTERTVPYGTVWNTDFIQYREINNRGRTYRTVLYCTVNTAQRYCITVLLHTMSVLNYD